MNELVRQIEILKRAITYTEDVFERLRLLDALRSAYLLGDDVPEAENTSRAYIDLALIYLRDDCTDEQKEIVLQRMFDAYVTLAPNDFHSYLMALEWHRAPKEKFYQPRIKILRPIVDDMTAMMVDDKYERMFLSMPPGTGKSTLGLFFLTWVIGRKPDRCNLAIGYSTPMAKSFFSRINSIDLDVEYAFHTIFPKLTRIYTSAKELEMDFSNDASDVKKPFVSLTCASVAGSLTGRTRCEELLYCDDMVEGAETAMSPTRLEKLWELYNSNARSRKKEGCKELHIGTRWSLQDPIGKLQTIYGESETTKIISIPALDENGESNFEYEYGVGFSTAMFEDLKATQSVLAWNSLYMQQPIEAEGLLFPIDQLKRYDFNSLNFENNRPDDIFAFCDVAFGGGDYLSMPIMGQWGSDDPVLLDVVFSKGSYNVTQPQVVGKIMQWGVQRCVFEANNGGDFYSEDIKRMLKERGYHCNVTTQRAPTRMSKESRIIQHQPAILKFKFRKQECYPEDGQYKAFMNQLITYSAEGTNDHDDAPDSCAGVATMLRTRVRAVAKTLARRFI